MQLILSQLVLLLTVLLNLFLIIFVNKDGGYAKRINQVLTAHILGVTGWGLFIFLNIAVAGVTNVWEYEPGSIGYQFEKLIFAFSTIWLAANYWFVKHFIKYPFRLKPLDYLVALFQFVILVLSLSDNVFYTEIAIMPEGYTVLAMQPISAVFSLYLFFHLLSPLFLLYFFMRRTTDEQKKAQAKTLFTIYLLFFIVSVITNWILPVYFQIFTFNALGPTLSLVLVAGIFYTVFKHHFLDIRLVIQRGLIYTFLLIVISFVYVLLINALGVVFGEATSLTSGASAGMTTLIGIFTVPYIDRYLRKKTDHFFFKDRYIYSEALYTLSEALNQHIRLSDTVAYTEESLKKIFKAETVQIKLFDSDTNTFDTPISQPTVLSLPLSFEQRVIGSVCLGPKLSGDVYTEEDVALLRTFAHQAATAFENTRLFREVEDYTRELEERVTERTEQIKELQSAQHQMLLDISHSLQTPLTVVKAQLGIIENLTPGSADLQLFEKSVDQVSSLIRELMNLAQLETVGLTERNWFNFSKLVNEQLEYFEVIAQSKQITLVAKIESNVLICGNEHMCKQLLDNLVSNAFKYTEHTTGEKLVSVTLAQTETSIILSVTDTGIGISETELPLIFGKFYRSNNAKKQAQGNGLGLAFVQAITKIHSGTTEVSSTLNQGSSFRFIFPKNIQAV